MLQGFRVDGRASWPKRLSRGSKDLSRAGILPLRSAQGQDDSSNNSEGKVNHPTSANSGQKWDTYLPTLAICGRMWTVLLALTMLLGLPSSAPAQAVKRLILTDGSYQAVTEWKIEGERVRYFSAERSEWEELPKALVNWKATEEWNAAAAQTQAEELKQVTEEELAARREAELNTPQVAPKVAPELRLPSEGGVFVLELQAGRPLLQPLQGVNPQENAHETANRLKKSLIPVPLLGQVQTLELKGAAAKVRLRSPTPEIFVDVEDEQGVIAGENFRIVRLERKRELRVVATTRVGLGGQSVKEMFLASRSEKFSGDWWKLVLLDGLTPGEYAIVIADRGEYRSELVWDFGVDP